MPENKNANYGLSDAEWEEVLADWRDAALDAGVETTDTAAMLIVLKSNWHFILDRKAARTKTLKREVKELKEAREAQVDNGRKIGEELLKKQAELNRLER